MQRQVLNRYQVQQQLSKNAGRQTLLARNLETQELVVIKLLTFNNDFEWNDLKLFEREAETLKALLHPQIPRYLDAFEVDTPTGKGFALVQTYIAGKSLEEQIKSGFRFNEQQVRQIAKSVLEILIYLHSCQPPVIHRDIKPSNILFIDDAENGEQIHLVDFGSVQTTTANDGNVTVVGTYGYMPPEQFGGRTVPASDLYSLGATLIYLVTGMHPADLPHQDGKIQFEHATNLSASFTNWLKKLTQPSLTRRFASAIEALQALNSQQSDIAPLITKSGGISVYKNADTLEILIPAQAFRKASNAASQPKIKLEFVSMSILYALLICLILVSIPLLSGVFILLFFPIVLSAIAFLAFKFIWASFGKVRLRFERQHYLNYELFGFKFNYSQPIQIQNNIKLEQIKEHKKTDAQGWQFEIKPQVIIGVGTQKYEIGANGKIAESELDTLANELQDWIGIE